MNLAKLKELEQAATKGPFGIDRDRRLGGVDQIVELATGRTLTIAFGTSDGNENDLPILVALRNLAPELIAVVEALELVTTSRDRHTLDWGRVSEADVTAGVKALDALHAKLAQEKCP